MTPAQEIRVFAAALIVAILAMFALVALEARMVDGRDATIRRMQEQHADDVRRWQVIVDRCNTDAAGGLACPDGTLDTTTSTSMTTKGSRP